MFVLDTCREHAPLVRHSADIRAEIDRLKDGLAASLARTTALEAARKILEPFDDDIVSPILWDITEGEKQNEEEQAALCEGIRDLQKEMRALTWQ